jgi:MFS family permease
LVIKVKKNTNFRFSIDRKKLFLGGMACVTVPPFLGEISSQKVRGAAGAAFQLSLTIGILMAQVIGLPCHSWGWGLAIVFLLPFAGIFVLFLLPNSPTQMIAKYKDEVQATEDLKKLRGTPNVQADIDAIHEQLTGAKTEPLSIPQVRNHDQTLSIHHSIFYLRYLDQLVIVGQC